MRANGDNFHPSDAYFTACAQNGGPPISCTCSKVCIWQMEIVTICFHFSQHLLMYRWKQVGRIIFYNESYPINQHFLKYNSNYQSCNFPSKSVTVYGAVFSRIWEPHFLHDQYIDYYIHQWNTTMAILNQIRPSKKFHKYNINFKTCCSINFWVNKFWVTN